MPTLLSNPSATVLSHAAMHAGRLMMSSSSTTSTHTSHDISRIASDQSLQTYDEQKLQTTLKGDTPYYLT